MGKYDDIINLERPKSNRIPMSRADRAKIFMPFSALKGYEEAIEEKQRVITERVELAEEQKEELDRTLKVLEKMLLKGREPVVKVIYFQADLKKSAEAHGNYGEYVETEGRLKNIDRVYEILVLEEITIPREDIFNIQIHAE